MTFYNQEIHNIGKIITFGSLNISLTLRLEKNDIQSLNINIHKIKSPKDLSFIIENENLWERIELSSKNELINTLIHMNRIKRIKNIVAYLIFDKIEFKEDTIKFQKLLDYILLINGIVIYSYPICDSKSNISFNIIYKNKTIKISLYGEEENNIYPEENENNINKEKYLIDEENKYDDDNSIGLFKNIPEEQVNFDDFKYLYLHLNEFSYGGQFSDIFKLKEFYNFLNHIKNNFKTKIILNFGENMKNCGKYLFELIKIVDIHIFRNKSELFDLLIKKKEIDDIKKQNNNRKLIENYKAQNNNKVKKVISLTNRSKSKNSLLSDFSISKINNNSGLKYTSFYINKKPENKCQSLKKLLINKSIKISQNLKKNLYFNKNNIFNYIRELIYNSHEQIINHKKNDKIGIYLDEYKKIYIINYKKLKFKPDIKEYEFNIYPKSNVHNLKEIQNINNILSINYSLFTYIIYGCILSTILDDISQEKENYYLFYLYIRLSILKILSIIKNGMEIPKNRDFYLIELNKRELNKIINDENNKKKENGFINDFSNCENKNNYNSIENFNTLYKEGLTHNDSFISKSSINSYKTNDKIFMKFLKDRKKQQKNLKYQLLTKNKDMRKTLYNNGIPDFSIYLTREQRKKLINTKLPLLKQENKNSTINIFLNAKISKINIKEKQNSISIDEKIKTLDTSKYKEIIFQPTPKEKDNF